MDDLKIILLCGGRLAVPTLQELAFFKVLAVVVIPSHCDEMIEEVTAILGGTNVPVITVDRTSCVQELSSAIINHNANLGLIITFSFKLPLSVISLPAKGFYNLHPGTLPGYRGPDPIFRQMKNLEPHAAITLHRLTDVTDGGPVVMEERVAIRNTDTYGLLVTKLAEAAARIVRVLVNLSQLNLRIPEKAQDESKSRYFKKQTAADVAIDWANMDAWQIAALVNACNPWNKGAITRIGQRIIRLLQVEAMDAPDNKVPPGTIIVLDGSEAAISASRGTIVKARLVYIDEGFFGAGILKNFGFRAGAMFDKI